MKIKLTAAFLPKVAQQGIHGHDGGAKEQVHLLKPDANSPHQNKRHLHSNTTFATW